MNSDKNLKTSWFFYKNTLKTYSTYFLEGFDSLETKEFFKVDDAG